MICSCSEAVEFSVSAEVRVCYIHILCPHSSLSPAVDTLLPSLAFLCSCQELTICVMELLLPMLVFI